MDDVEFYDLNQGPMLLREWHGDLWLFVKGAEGQWVSFRKASLDDSWIFASAFGKDYEVFDSELMERELLDGNWSPGDHPNEYDDQLICVDQDDES